jgi:hypothetical protein
VPVYSYLHVDNGSVEDITMSISEMIEFEKDLTAMGLSRYAD